jgi:hypothetical protein
MAFRGIYPAPPLKPMEFGLLSGARVMTHTARDYDEKWIRGFAQEFDSSPTLNLLDEVGAELHQMFDSSGLERYLDHKPFFIEVEDFRSTFSLATEDRFARVLKQIEAATQKAVERELWDGYFARDYAGANNYLCQLSSLTYASAAPGTAVSAARALSLLEGALANSPTGEQGLHHITRDVAVLLGSNWLLSRIEDPDFEGQYHIETITGTTVVIGAGYTGNGPVHSITTKALTSNVATITTGSSHYLTTGETVTVAGVDATFDGTYTVASAPTANTFTYAKEAGNVGSTADTGTAQMQGSTTTKWVYATASVDVHLGKPEVVNDNLAQGYDVSGNQNDMRIKAIRPASVYFGPSSHYAVKVDLTS